MGLVTGLLIAGVAAQAYGAYQQSRAAKKASEQQVASADKALEIQQQQYQQTREDLAPYRQQGTQGLTALSAFLGVPTAPTGAAGAPPSAAALSPQAFARAAQGAMATHAVPRSAAPPQGQSAYAPPRSPGAGGLVLLKAPTGQTQAVPADQVDYYLARGATRG